MTSPFANLFLALQGYISGLQSDGNPIFNYVDHDLGQLNFERPAIPTNGPAVLIDFDDSAFLPLGNNAQEGTLRIRISVIFFPYNATSNGTPEEFKEMGLGYYNSEYTLHCALQGWLPSSVSGFESLGDIFGPLVRTNVRTQRHHTAIRIREITYAVNIDDFSTIPTQLTSPASPGLTIQMTQPTTQPD